MGSEMCIRDSTGSELLPNGLAHPVALFHVPILGAGTSIGEMFELGHANSPFSIGIESYEWEIHQPLLEEVTYKISGKIEGAERKNEAGRVFDRIQFRFDLALEGSPVASSTIIWHYNRGRSDED